MLFDFLYLEEFDKKKLYKCPLPCGIETFFGQSMSRSLFPSQYYSRELVKHLRNFTHMKDIVGSIKDETQFAR